MSSVKQPCPIYIHLCCFQDLYNVRMREIGRIIILRFWKGHEKEGRYQLLAAMQAYKNHTRVWPVGFLVEKDHMQLMEALERSGHVMVTLVSFATTRLDHVLAFTEQLVHMIATRDLVAATKNLAIRYPSLMERLHKLEEGQKEFRMALARIESTIKDLTD